MARPDDRIMPDFCSRRLPFHYITALNLLTKIGVDPFTVQIRAEGEYENYRGQVHDQSPEPGTILRPDTRITLYVGYSSAVDLFPYQFFYGLKGITDRSGDGWENQARELLAPFEGAVVKYEALAHYLTLKYRFGVAERSQILDFLGLFGFTAPDAQTMPLDELMIWVGLMPYFNFWAGNADLVSHIIGMIFNCRVKILENTPNTYSVPQELHYTLGSQKGALGRDTIIGKDFTEFDSGCEIHIKNLPCDKLMEFLPGRPLRQKLDWILSFCMPGSLIPVVHVSGLRRDLVLGNKQQKTYLGYASYL